MGKRFQIEFTGSIILSEYDIWPEEGDDVPEHPTPKDVLKVLRREGVDYIIRNGLENSLDFHVMPLPDIKKINND